MGWFKKKKGGRKFGNFLRSAMKMGARKLGLNPKLVDAINPKPGSSSKSKSAPKPSFRTTTVASEEPKKENFMKKAIGWMKENAVAVIVVGSITVGGLIYKFAFSGKKGSRRRKSRR